MLDLLEKRTFRECSIYECFPQWSFFVTLTFHLVTELSNSIIYTSPSDLYYMHLSNETNELLLTRVCHCNWVQAISSDETNETHLARGEVYTHKSTSRSDEPHFVKG